MLSGKGVRITAWTRVESYRDRRFKGCIPTDEPELIIVPDLKATRSEKRAANYRAMVVIATLMIRLTA